MKWIDFYFAVALVSLFEFALFAIDITFLYPWVSPFFMALTGLGFLVCEWMIPEETSKESFFGL